MKRMVYVLSGFVLGALVAGIFSARSLEAQSLFGAKQKGEKFSYENMTPPVPARFGYLVAVSGIDLYFQGENGTVYIVKPRSGNSLDTQVSVIPRV